MAASRGESAYVIDCGDFYLASITECLGTKALVADAMRAITGRTYYDRIAQDTLAMAINDLITVGATPISVHAYWATRRQRLVLRTPSARAISSRAGRRRATAAACRGAAARRRRWPAS